MRGRPTDPSTAGHPSDAELADLVRSPGSDAPVAELHRRHRSAVLSYAYACCRTPHSAGELTSQVFARTLIAVRSGSGPRAAWRPYLLTAVRRRAAEWADAEGRTGLSPEFERWLADLPESPESDSVEARMRRMEDGSLVLRAFRSLTERRQTVLWHTEVEGEPARFVGRLLGLDENDVAPFASRARSGLREACLAVIANQAGTDECRRYGPMLGAVVRRTGRRRTEDFDRHLSRCPRCRTGLDELDALDEGLGPVLSAAVLPWGSTAYGAARMTEAGAGAVGAASDAPGDGVPTDGDTRWRSWTTASPLRSGAVAGGMVAAVGLAVLVLPIRPDDRSEEPSSAQPVAVRTRTVQTEQPPVTVTVTARPSAPRSPHPTEPPTARTSHAPSASHPAPLGTVTWTGTLRNAGLATKCVESLGTTVVQNTCDGRPGQVWKSVAFEGKPGYGWLRNGATGECVDYLDSPQRMYGNSANVAVVMGPCRRSGEGQLFRFDPFTGGDHSFLVRAERAPGKPWNEMQLGMLDWYVEGGPPPETNAPVALTFNYYNSPQLRYFAAAVTP
ncbi:DNA-directed RNA polymerase specialized sigma subunit, sigma24 family [Streptomyces sp. cf386]|uniref:hypothetical protein n=1 Tax=Streptomyces sp. cf386 TaxID=1761904 RepID=UPI00088291E1|nr:hypothetical protein [Streptomyces sp. cf386]SDO04260.1 DNA-directed RNA polymerase specialized sigma subunit, sigma24 family [Streptomyces sp. cf386]